MYAEIFALWSVFLTIIEPLGEIILDISVIQWFNSVFLGLICRYALLLLLKNENFMFVSTDKQVFTISYELFLIKLTETEIKCSDMYPISRCTTIYLMSINKIYLIPLSEFISKKI